MLAQVVPTILVFVVLLALAIFSWQSTEKTLEAQQARALDEDIIMIETGLADRTYASATLLRAGVGLFEASVSVDQGEWKRFYEKFALEGRYKGVSVVGFAPVVRAQERVQFERLLDAEYDGKYSINTKSSQQLLAPVLYAESFDDLSGMPIGFDLYQSPERKQALDTARDSGEITMTSVITHANSEARGVLMAAPVYARGVSHDSVQERRAALQGFVYVSLRTQELFQSIVLNDSDTFGYTVSEIKDGETIEVYSSQFVRDHPELTSRASSQIEHYGKRWNLTYFAASGIVSPAESARPINVLLTGIILASVASMAVFFLIKYRTRMFAISEEQKLQEAKDELLSLASHQLRTPATGVKQYVGMVMDGFAGTIKKDQARLLEQAYKSNERQLQIINEFLYVAKLGSGSLTTTLHQFDLAPVVRDVYAEMKLDIQDKKHKVKLKVPREVRIVADQHSVRMIIENLLSNALKYTPSGGTIGLTVEKGIREVRVVVSDTGIGIDKKDMPLLFKQFSRIPNELSSEISGSGIGLYLAQQLAIRNGGNITVESERGNGSIFTLHLPVRRVKNLTKTSSNT